MDKIKILETSEIQKKGISDSFRIENPDSHRKYNFRDSQEPKRVLEMTEFSAGICGVWNRVFQEAKLLAEKGHDVHVFSSNLEKGTNKIVPAYEEKDGIKIHRFPVYFKLGNAHFWNFKKQALKLEPDAIIAHIYRHPHTNKGVKIAGKLRKKGHKAKLYLVTHAPFLEKGIRSRGLELGVLLYDVLFCNNLNRFDKVIAITKWEIPNLLELGCKKEKIVYIPNGIPEGFFKTKRRQGNKIIFFGRIAPIKDLETFIQAVKQVSEKKKISVEIIGPAEPNYLVKLKQLIEELGLNNIVRFLPAVYKQQDKIKTIDSAGIFVLPSKREGMPQALIEAMARGKLVISSDTQGGKEIIKSGRNGLIFKKGDENELTEKIFYCMDSRNKRKIKQIEKNAIKTSEQFKWSKLIKKVEELL